MGSRLITKRAAIGIGVLAATIVLALVLGYLNSIPPLPLTVSRAASVRDAVAKYLRVHNSLPKSMSDLQKQYSDDGYQWDGWGKPFVLRTEGDGTVCVLSAHEGTDRIWAKWRLRRQEDRWCDTDISKWTDRSSWEIDPRDNLRPTNARP